MPPEAVEDLCELHGYAKTELGLAEEPDEDVTCEMQEAVDVYVELKRVFGDDPIEQLARVLWRLGVVPLNASTEDVITALGRLEEATPR